MTNDSTPAFQAGAFAVSLTSYCPIHLICWTSDPVEGVSSEILQKLSFRLAVLRSSQGKHVGVVGGGTNLVV